MISIEVIDKRKGHRLLGREKDKVKNEYGERSQKVKCKKWGK